MKKPLFVTFTGIDAMTDLDRVVDLSSRYSVEWGVLASKDRSGVEPRYPALSLYDQLRSRPGAFALHLCGRWARNAIADGAVDDDLVRAADGVFDRVQFNVPDGESWMSEESGRSNLVSVVDRLRAARAIVQCRGHLFPSQDAVDWLHDCSGGAGVATKEWPIVPEGADLVGYAGGIGPDTVLGVLEAIGQTHPTDVDYYIDMESRVRTDDVLDLDKCEAVLKAVYGEAT